MTSLDSFRSRATLDGYDWLRAHVTDPASNATVREMQEVAADLDCTLAQLAIAWCASNPNVSTVITGASRVEQVHENLGALDVLEQLDADVLERIDDLLARCRFVHVCGTLDHDDVARRRAACTPGRRVRRLRLRGRDALTRAPRTRAADPAFQTLCRQHRPMVERSIAWLVAHGHRRVRYRGITRNQAGLSTPGAVTAMSRSDGTIPIRSCIASSRLPSAPCGTATPLGLPVEPEV